MRKIEIKYRFDEETKATTCTIWDKVTDRYYTGVAFCHQDDLDMCSEHTGQEIAYRRAEIQLLQQCRSDVKFELKSLKQLFYSINMSKYYNSKSYENRAIRRQIKIKESELEGLTNAVYDRKEALKQFIDSKDEFYKAIRANRKK